MKQFLADFAANTALIIGLVFLVTAENVEQPVRFFLLVAAGALIVAGVRAAARQEARRLSRRSELDRKAGLP